MPRASWRGSCAFLWCPARFICRRLGAECRCDRRCQRHRHHDQSQSARRRLAVIDVADHRTAQLNAGADAERLQNASRDQRRQRPCGAAQRRADEEVAVREPSPGFAHAPAVHGRIRFGRHEHDGVVLRLELGELKRA